MGSRTWLRFAADDRLVGFVRRGDATAFEILYDRHCRELLSFCRYILGSRHDAEDAVQSTFASAYRSLLADERRVAVRPWLFAIARNACLSILRQRRAAGEGDGVPEPGEDPVAQVEQREDLRQALSTMLELPERQRAALVLAELHGLSQREIGALLGVGAEQVKSYVYQARTSLISERRARDADCREIREELATARGAALLKSHLRRHLRSCPACRDYAEELSRQRRRLGILLPVAPSLALKRRALEAALGRAPGTGTGTCVSGTAAGASAVGTAAELAGGGVKALVAKLLAGVAFLGASTGVGAPLLGVATTHLGPAAPASSPGRLTQLRLAASVGAETTAGPRGDISTLAPRPQAGGRLPGVGGHPGQLSVAVIQQRLRASQSSGSASHRDGNSVSHRKNGSHRNSGIGGTASRSNPASHGTSGGHGKSDGHRNGGIGGAASHRKPVGHGSHVSQNISRSHGNGAAGHGSGGSSAHGDSSNSAHGGVNHGNGGNVSATPASLGPQNASPYKEAGPQNIAGTPDSGGARGGGSAQGRGERDKSAGAANVAPDGGPHKH
ncbi:MAG TPA: sigma-70 family RNA polymerase sigma factor [Solirubrobacteraceae bacterium]|nr:sigma-70 family RNA polymerase sigma factor [Solirubrobacteraceae bacterium]